MNDETGTFPGAPTSILDTPAGAPPAPTPGGDAPKPRGNVTRPVVPPRKRGRPRKATPDAVDAAAAAAAKTLEREPRGAGRPSKADQDNDVLRQGLVNFYNGLGAMLNVAGMFVRNDRIRDVGAAMLTQSKACADALVAAADQSPALRRALSSVTLAGGASLVLAAHGPIIAAALGFGSPAASAGDPQPSDAAGPGMDIGSLLGMFMADAPAA